MNVWRPKHLDGTASPLRVVTRILSHQPLQCRGIVNIVPRRQFHEIKSKLCRPGACGCGHGAGAPGDIGEQPRVGKAHPEEVYPPSSQAPSTTHRWLPARRVLTAVARKLGRECRGVRTQYTCGGVACCEHLLDCMEEAASEPLHSLRNGCGAVSQNADGSFRHMRDEGLFRSRRRIGGIPDDRHRKRGPGDIGGGIMQESSAQRCRLFGAEGRA